MIEVTANQLQTALEAKDKAAFISHINNCSDFNLIFDFTIQCAALVEKTRFYEIFERDKLKDMMASGLKRMTTHPLVDWCHARDSFSDWNALLRGQARDPRQLIVCAQVIEDYFSDSEREKLLTFHTEGGLSLGYLLWKCCPKIMNERYFPKISNFISEHITFYIKNGNWDLRRNQYNEFFNILIFGMKKKLISDDYVLKHFGEYTNTLFQYWRKVKTDTKRKAVIILSRRIPVPANKDIRRFLAQQIIHEAHMKTCAVLDSTDIYTAVNGELIAHRLRKVCGNKNDDNPELVRILLDARPDAIHATNPYGTTSLHRAAFAGNMRMVRVLLERGADVNKKDQGNFSPLDYAVSEGHVEVARVLRAADPAERKQAATTFMGVGNKYKRGIFASEQLKQLPPDVMRCIGKIIKTSSAAM